MDSIDELIKKLDACARGVDEYDYGLPILWNGPMTDMRTIILDWLKERERKSE